MWVRDLSKAAGGDGGSIGLTGGSFCGLGRRLFVPIDLVFGRRGFGNFGGSSALGIVVFEALDEVGLLAVVREAALLAQRLQLVVLLLGVFCYCCCRGGVAIGTLLWSEESWWCAIRNAR